MAIVMVAMMVMVVAVVVLVVMVVVMMRTTAVDCRRGRGRFRVLATTAEKHDGYGAAPFVALLGAAGTTGTATTEQRQAKRATPGRFAGQTIFDIQMATAATGGTVRTTRTRAGGRPQTLQQHRVTAGGGRRSGR